MWEMGLKEEQVDEGRGEVKAESAGGHVDDLIKIRRVGGRGEEGDGGIAEGKRGRDICLPSSRSVVFAGPCGTAFQIPVSFQEEEQRYARY